ncbi:hypothetical protein [Flavobacterium hibernum]|jgi:hypothetical protein|uniref:Uncharacterized protein n=1 Tax=Flavobacterium hibernum TaxID=37752 RepID=A0A0D0F4R1_9FLAO|nr:hypothetical protein [Flavobacterium hibernum]KIO54661.1 hypothetical protein IW18_01250 [Flavobacterium hibernum]OXA84731.1 hypothetical protein B0A73_19155 [Flavobacterium hibernum]STO18411.1 Uncharacterised protein [Flavobacterium hibernum]
MDIDYQDRNIFETDYIFRIQTFEKYLESPAASQQHYAEYKAGLIPNIFYAHNMKDVLSLFKEEYDDIKSGLERYETDDNNDFPMLKSYVNTERNLRKILDKDQLRDYTTLLERSFDSQKTDAKATAVSRFFLSSPILESYIYQIEKVFGKGILD